MRGGSQKLADGLTGQGVGQNSPWSEASLSGKGLTTLCWVTRIPTSSGSHHLASCPCRSRAGDCPLHPQPLSALTEHSKFSASTLRVASMFLKVTK